MSAGHKFKHVVVKNTGDYELVCVGTSGNFTQALAPQEELRILSEDTYALEADSKPMIQITFSEQKVSIKKGFDKPPSGYEAKIVTVMA